MERKSPKEQLAAQELIGFDRRDDAPGQTVCRASSAKVVTKSTALGSTS